MFLDTKQRLIIPSPFLSLLVFPNFVRIPDCERVDKRIRGPQTWSGWSPRGRIFRYTFMYMYQYILGVYRSSVRIYIPFYKNRVCL